MSENETDVVLNEAIDQPETPAEKLVPQSTVNHLITAKSKAAYEKGKRDAMNELQNAAPEQQQGEAPAIAQAPQPQVQAQAQPQQFGGMAQNVNPDQIRQMIAEEGQKQQALLQQQQEQAHAQRFVQEFDQKLAAGSHKYPDFNDVVKPVREKLGLYPNVAFLANHMENMPDVMYDLAQNRLKLATLENLAKGDPEGALKEIQKLSNSIKMNQAASNNTRIAPEPLDQISPSLTKTDNGSYSMQDFRSMAKKWS